MHPERGCLGPGDCALCVLNFTPTDYPTVYMLDLVCQVPQMCHCLIKDVLSGRWSYFLLNVTTGLTDNSFT